jgi:membrane peptidoglycan carboxypeptidase
MALGRAAALPGFAAGKTGTAQDYRDAWFIGFDNSLTVGVWVGNDDHSPMQRVVGGSIPAMIWKNFMTQAESTTTVASTGAPILADQTATSAAAATPAPSAEQTASKQDSEKASRPSHSLVGACNVRTCSEFYHSFDASDCTYQPYSGGAAADAPSSAFQPLARAAAKRRVDVRFVDETSSCRECCSSALIRSKEVTKRKTPHRRSPAGDITSRRCKSRHGF